MAQDIVPVGPTGGSNTWIVPGAAGSGRTRHIVQPDPDRANSTTLPWKWRRGLAQAETRTWRPAEVRNTSWMAVASCATRTGAIVPVGLPGGADAWTGVAMAHPLGMRPRHFSPGLPWVACTEERGAHSGRHRDDRSLDRSSPCLRTSDVAKRSASTFLRMKARYATPAGPNHARSKRSRFMTLFQAAMKSHTNACCESSQA